MATSRARRLVCPTLSDVRKSSADGKACLATPGSPNRSRSDSRPDSSSSTADATEPPAIGRAHEALLSCVHQALVSVLLGGNCDRLRCVSR
jgi:hypothetical protein